MEFLDAPLGGSRPSILDAISLAGLKSFSINKLSGSLFVSLMEFIEMSLF